MPGALDSTLRNVAEQLIERFGGAGTYRRVVETFSAATGQVSKTETLHSVISTPPEPYNQNRIDGDVVQVGDLRTMLKAQNLGFVPSVGDLFTFNGTTWQVVRVEPLYSGAQAAAYEIQLRQ